MRCNPTLLLIPFAFACTTETTAPRVVPVKPLFSVLAADDETPKILRFQTQYAFVIFDTKTDLAGFAGLPDDITRSADCGGPDPFAIADVKQVTVRDDVMHWLLRGQNVNLDVYRLSTLEDICTQQPLAHGKGVIKYHDNDLIEAGPENTFGWYAQGPVTLAAGGTATLLEHNLWQLLPTGTFRRIFRQVKLLGP